MNAPVPDTALELAGHALGLAPRGADVQVTVIRERSLVSRFARSCPTQATAVEDTVVEVLSVRDGHTGTAVTNDLGDGALRAAAARADAVALAAARSGPGGHPGLAGPAAPSPAHDGFDPSTAELDAATAHAALAATFAVAAEHGLEAFGIWTAGVVETAIATTTGVRLAERVTDAYMKVVCRDDRAPARTGYASAAGSAAAMLDPEALAREAAGRVSPAEPLTLAPGTYPVVLEPQAVGTLLDFLGSMAFNGQVHAEGRGALTGRLGTRVAATAITLVDAPGSAHTLPRAFDAEGTPKGPLPLIDDGVARSVVHDRRTAALAGGDARSTGHALRPGGSPWGAEPTNLVLSGGGAADTGELMAPIERGIYVTRLWYVNAVREQETLLTGMTRDGTFLIEDGRLGPPLLDVRFTDSVLRLLSATEALTAGRRLACEAELYGRRFAHGVVCPALRAGGFRVTGATT